MRPFPSHHPLANEKTSNPDEVYPAIAESGSIGDFRLVFERAVQQSIDGIAVCELGGKVLFVNPAWAEIHGRTAGSVVGETFAIFHTPEQMESDVLSHIRALDERGWNEGEVGHVRADGSEFVTWMTTTVMQDGDGKPIGYVAVCRDQTERIDAAKTLRDTEARHRTVFEQTAQGIVVADIETRKFLYANPSFCRMYGYAPEEITNWGLGDAHPPDRLAEVEAEFKAQACGKKTLARALPCLRKDGSIFYADINSAPAMIDGRQCVLGFFTDVTEHRRAEEERNQLEAKLHEAQRLESMGVLAGGIAHDFNNLLVSILGNASFILLDLPEDAPQRRQIEQIDKAAQMAADLTNQMLAYSGGGKFMPIELDLNRAIQDVTHLLEVSISKKARLTYEYTASLPPIVGDVTQIRQIAMNLLTNASEALPTSGGRIAISTGLRTLDPAKAEQLHAAKDLVPGEYVYLRVTDDGSGMDSETIKKSFDPFYTTKFAGRGLGLASVLGIVSAHHGGIEVSSRQGQGTTFTVYLPVSRQDAKPIEAEQPVDDTEVSSKTILVVDDEPGVRELLKMVLEPQGYRVLTACDGQEGLDVLRENSEQINLVLLDLTMPVMSGEEALVAMHELRLDLPVLLMSGHSATPPSMQSRIGAVDFIQKPFRAADILGRVKSRIAPREFAGPR